MRYFPSLNQLKQYLQLLRTRLDLLLINVILVLFVFGIIALLLLPERPVSEPVPQTKLPSTETIKENFSLEYYGDKTQPFTSLPYYQGTNVVTPETFLSRVVRLHALEPTTYSQDTYYSTDQSIRMSVTPDQNYAEISFADNRPQDNGTAPTTEQAQAAAEQYLQSLGFDLEDVTYQPEETQYYGQIGQNSEFHPVNQAEKASLIRVAYQRRLQNLPLLISSQSLEAIEIDITANGLYKARFNPIAFETEEQGVLQTITIDEALSQIRQGNYSLSTSILRGSMRGNRSVDTMILQQVEVVYRLSLEDRQILPYYDFRGEVRLKDNTFSPVEVITPAVRTDLLEIETTEQPETIRE